MSIDLRRAGETDRDAVSRLLDNALLPIADVGQLDMSRFLVAESGRELIGCVGAEVFGSAALLRSLVVADAARGAGLGKRLLAAVESRLRSAGVSQAWLLTTGADDFFARLGFRVRPRNAAPPEIRGTAEFSALCPADAVLMSKFID